MYNYNSVFITSFFWCVLVFPKLYDSVSCFFDIIVLNEFIVYTCGQTLTATINESPSDMNLYVQVSELITQELYIYHII